MYKYEIPAIETSLPHVLYVVLAKYKSKNKIKCDQGQGTAAKYSVAEMQPADRDVFWTSSGRLKKATTSYETKQDVIAMSGKRRRIYNVLKTSDLRRLKDVEFLKSWRRLIYVIVKMSNLRRLKNVCFTTSSGRLI